MCCKQRQRNYYVGFGMLLSTSCYFLKEAGLIPDWMRLVGYILAIGLMMYGVFKPQKNDRNLG